MSDENFPVQNQNQETDQHLRDGLKRNAVKKINNIKYGPSVFQQINDNVALNLQYQTTLAYLYCFHEGLTLSYTPLIKLTAGGYSPIKWCCKPIDQSNEQYVSTSEFQCTPTRYYCNNHMIGYTHDFLLKMCNGNPKTNQMLRVDEINVIPNQIDYDFLRKHVKPEGILKLSTLQTFPVVPKITTMIEGIKSDIIIPCAIMTVHAPCLSANSSTKGLPCSQAGIMNYGSANGSKQTSDKISFRCQCINTPNGFFLFLRPNTLQDAGTDGYLSLVLLGYLDYYHRKPVTTTNTNETVAPAIIQNQMASF